MRFPTVASRSAVSTMLLGGLFPPQPKELGPPLVGDSAPSWADLKSMAEQTATGQQLLKAESERALGAGAAHTDAKLRLFGGKESDVRVTLYRDTAGWCP